MSDLQFAEWFVYHTARFTKVGVDFGTLPEAVRRQVRAAWIDTLRLVAIEDAKAATDELFSGPQRPPFFDRIPATIREIAKRRESDRRQAERSHQAVMQHDSCIKCDGGGQVSVYVRGLMLQQVMSQIGGDLDKASRRTCAVLCDCDAGRLLMQARHGFRQAVIQDEDLATRTFMP